jgi:hypothetical protein
MGIFPEELRNITNTSVSVGSVSTEIRSKNLPNTNLEFYRWPTLALISMIYFYYFI